MASSGSKSVSFTQWDDLKFSWWISDQSVENNSSVVSWKMELVSGQYGQINASSQSAWEITVNGTKYTGKENIGIANNATKTLASGSTTIAHNADGSKSFSYSFSQTMHITFSGEYISIVSGSGSGTLDTIARKSTMSVSNGTLGVKQTIKIAKSAEGFTHTIRYYIGDDYWTIANKTEEDSVDLTVPLERASYNTSGTSLALVFHIITYNGNAEIGTNIYTRTFTIPIDEVKPSIAVSTVDPTGNKDIYGYFVKGLSTCNVSVDAELAYGSQISSYSVTINGVTYPYSEVTTGVILSTESLSVSVTVKDKRGATATWSGSYNVLDYSAPKVSSLSVNRCDENGTTNAEGSFIKVTFSAAVTALRDRNTASYELRYKESSASAYTSVPFNDLKNVFSVSGKTYIFSADINSPYDIVVIATDSHSSASRNTSASTAFTLMNWHGNGKAMGIGMVSEDSGLSVGFGMKLYGGIESVASTKEKSSRLALGIGKHLWGTGTWDASNPTITVEDLQNYTLFRLKVKGVNANILAFNVGGNLRGHGGYAETNRHRSYAISAVVDGNTLSLTVCSLVLHTSGGSHSTIENVSISDIWGIF